MSVQSNKYVLQMLIGSKWYDLEDFDKYEDALGVYNDYKPDSEDNHTRIVFRQLMEQYLIGYDDDAPW